MNQDNNFNQNNFNSQGTNGMYNNQPLNNKSFNQGITVNPQSINQEPQLTPNFQQPVMQEPIPQSMSNTFENSNTHNQSFNSKPPKKMNLGLIIGGIAGVAIIVAGIIIVPKLFNKKWRSFCTI